MKRFALTALTAVLFASGSTVAMAQTTTTTTTTTTTVTETANPAQPGGDPAAASAKEELLGTQPQAKSEAASTGNVAATEEKVGQEGGAEGTTASLVTEDTKIEKESNVEGADPENMMEKGSTATIN